MAIKIPLDFTGVEASTTVRVSEGDYVAKVVEVKKTTSKSSNNPMLIVTFEGQSGELKGRRIRDNHVLIKDSLWTLRNMLEAMGFKVKPSKMNFTDAMVMGKSVGLTLVDGEEYKGRIKSEVADYLPVSAVGNKVSGSDVEDLGDTDDEEDPLAAFEDDEPEEDEEEIEEEDGDDDDDSDEWEMEDDEEDDEDEETEDEAVEEVDLSFTLEEVSTAKGPELKAYLTEAMEAGWEFDLGDKPKVAEVREALSSLFEDEDSEDDEDMEGFSLDDME